MAVFLLEIFIVSFLLNVVWEFSHCMLYKTCWKMRWFTLIKLLLKMSLKDGLWICIFYVISFFSFHTPNPINYWLELWLFTIMALLFAFIDEKISVNMKRWEYGPKMPLVYGVGLTPLLELAVTGILAFYLVAIL